MAEARQPAVRGSEHHRHVPKQYIALNINVVTFRVLNIHVDRRCICHISDTALLRKDVVGNTVFLNCWHPYPDVRELEVEVTRWVVLALGGCITGDDGIRPHNFFDLAIDEVVE